MRASKYILYLVRGGERPWPVCFQRLLWAAAAAGEMGFNPRTLLFLMHVVFLDHIVGHRALAVSNNNPTLTFCVPKGHQNTNAQRFGSKLQFVQRWWNGDFGTQEDLSGLHNVFFFNWNPRVGFSSCESLGAEVELVNYMKGNLVLGGFFRRGKVQLTLRSPAAKDNVVGVVSELEIKDVVRICTHGNEGAGEMRALFSVFAHDHESVDSLLKRKQQRGRSELLRLPSPLDANGQFGLYSKSKRGGSLMHIFSRGHAPRPLLWPLLLSKLRRVKMSATTHLGFAAHRFTLAMTPTGQRGDAAFMDDYASQKLGVITDILYGSNIFVHSNITFLVTPGRSRAFGREFTSVKNSIIDDITNTLLQARTIELDDTGGIGHPGLGACSWSKKGGEGAKIFGEGSRRVNVCPLDAYKDKLGKYHVIDEAPLRVFQKRNPSITLAALLWRKLDADDQAHVWSRRNCDPLCHSIINYTGTRGEDRKMSLRETYRFLALWHRFVDFPLEFISEFEYLSDNVNIRTDALVFAAGSRHSLPIGVQVSRQTATASHETESNITRRSRVFADTPSHLNQVAFERRWELVLFSAQECVYAFTPSVATLDLIISSSLMAALVAWIVVLVSLWLLLGEVAVHLTTNHGVTLPPFIQIAQAPIHLHVVYFNLATTEQMFENWRSGSRSGVVERVAPPQ